MVKDLEETIYFYPGDRPRSGSARASGRTGDRRARPGRRRQLHAAHRVIHRWPNGAEGIRDVLSG